MEIGAYKPGRLHYSQQALSSFISKLRFREAIFGDFQSAVDRGKAFPRLGYLRHALRPVKLVGNSLLISMTIFRRLCYA